MARIILLTVMIFLYLTAIPVEAARYKVTNATGVDIYEMYVSPTHRERWSQNLMMGRILKSGQSCYVIWNPTGTYHWDMFVKDGEGNRMEWINFNVKEIAKINLETDHLSGSK